MNTSIKDFVDVGDSSAPIGSPAWCQAAHVQLCATKRQTDWEVRRLKYDLLEFKNKERWKQLSGNKGRPFHSWKQYVQTPEPNGLGMPLESVEEVLEALDNTLIGQVLGKQGRPKKGEEKPYNVRLKYGNDPDYIRLRLARDRPDILQRWEAGEFKNASAAARAAGIKLAQDALQKLESAWKNASDEQKRQFVINHAREIGVNIIDD